MTAVLRALVLAARDAMQPRILLVLLLPALASLAAWSIAAWIWWDAWTAHLAAALSGGWFARWSTAWGGWLVPSASTVLVLAALVPAMIVTALVVNEIVVMPLVLSFVRHRHYPQLAHHGFGTLRGSLANALASGALFVVLWIVTLPLWLTLVGAVLVPAANSAYLNMRVFGYDALADCASAAEYRELKRRANGRLFALGLALSVLYYVPVINLAATVFSSLAYAHLCLDELRRLRNADLR